jgi:hypothetical protein
MPPSFSRTGRRCGPRGTGPSRLVGSVGPPGSCASKASSLAHDRDSQGPSRFEAHLQLYRPVGILNGVRDESVVRSAASSVVVLGISSTAISMTRRAAARAHVSGGR